MSLSMLDNRRHVARERFKLGVRAALGRRNLDLVRDPYPGRVARALTLLGVDTVLDVGANLGQFGAALRTHGFRGRLLSFEPLPDAYRLLERRARRDGAWTAVNEAVGADRGTVVLRVAANSHSSSLLDMTDTHLRAAPDSCTVARIEVPVTTVEEVVATHGIQPGRVLLKIDTQGYESQVLRGAGDFLSDFAAIQLELSYVCLYEGQEMAEALISRLHTAGFGLFALDASLHDPGTGRLLQADALFAARRSFADGGPAWQDGS
ncbi:MAG: FkbM family methyltransferase [Propionibacteriales bacterium]|nr:FkbM family methyltransferase [Propionibacteriales bacterium]